MHYEIDITREHCPMTLVRTKLQLAKMAAGDTLGVLLTEGEPLNNIPRAATEQGFKVLGVEHVEGKVHRVNIEK